MTADLALLKRTVEEAGELALVLRSRPLEIHSKPGGSPVTNADLAVDEFLKERLMAARPDYGWLSEETPDNPDRLGKARCFFSDPIDGTTAFIKDRDWWSICIAVVEDGRPTVGVVFAPSTGEVFEAVAGGGALRNGEPIRVSDHHIIEDSAMLGDAKMFAHPSWPKPWPPMRIEQRNSIAYRLSLIACGEFDAAVAMAPKHDWDLAAGDLIVTEAGGRVTDHLDRGFVYNRPDPRQRSLVCANPALHSLLLQRLEHIQD